MLSAATQLLNIIWRFFCRRRPVELIDSAEENAVLKEWCCKAALPRHLSSRHFDYRIGARKAL